LRLINNVKDKLTTTKKLRKPQELNGKKTQRQIWFSKFRNTVSIKIIFFYQIEITRVMTAMN